MRRILALLTLLFLVAGCENVQSPGELTLQTRGALDVLPAHVQTVGMVNFETARTSQAFAVASEGRFSLDQMGGEHSARFEDFIATTGFDPDEDLHRVYFGATEGDNKVPYFVVYADYERDRIDAYINEQADLELERSTYADAPVYVTARDGDEMAFALVNDDMIIASSQAGVFEMLDRIESGNGGLGSDAAMMDLVRRAGHPDDMWIAVRDLDTPTGGADVDHPMEQAGRMMKDVVVSVGFGDDALDIEADGITRAEASPSDVADLVRGTVSVMKLQVESEEALFDVLDRVRVEDTRDGIEVRARMTTDALRAMRATGDA